MKKFITNFSIIYLTNVAAAIVSFPIYILFMYIFDSRDYLMYGSSSIIGFWYYLIGQILFLIPWSLLFYIIYPKLNIGSDGKVRIFIVFLILFVAEQLFLQLFFTDKRVTLSKKIFLLASQFFGMIVFYFSFALLYFKLVQKRIKWPSSLP